LSVDAANSQEVGENVHKRLELALADANKAIELAPTLALAYRAKLVVLHSGYLDHQHLVEASELMDKAMALGPGDAEILSGVSIFMAYLGRFDMAVATARKAVELDPLTANSYRRLAVVLIYARNYPASMEAIHRALALDPRVIEGYADLCWAQYLTGQLDAALQSCSQQPDYWLNQTQLAIILDKLHRRSEAEATLAKLKAAQGDDASIQYAEIYSQWGDIPRALDALEAAFRVRDPGLSTLQSDPGLDPVRGQPRFQAIVKKIGFPP
jgi:tetratricopeptide (TPR) repeat protein